MDFFKKERFLTTGENSTANLFWSLTICGFPQYSYAEDKAHNFRCCACHPKYAFVPQSIVLYRENLQSLTYQPKKNLMRNWILIASDFEQFLKEKHLSREYGDLIFFHLLIGAMYLAKEEMTYQGEKKFVSRRRY